MVANVGSFQQRVAQSPARELVNPGRVQHQAVGGVIRLRRFGVPLVAHDAVFRDASGITAVTDLG